MEQDKKLIGRAEQVDFPEMGYTKVATRIDTGARTSSVWVSSAIERSGVLQVVFFAPGTEHYDKVTHTFETFDQTVVASSNGQAQARYKVRLLVKVKGKRIRAWFTLADRSTQVYPVLIGRNVLAGKFVVDVKKGRILRDAEQQRTQRLQAELDNSKEEKA